MKIECQSWKRKRDVDRRKVEIEIPIKFKQVIGKNSTQFISKANYLMKQYMPLDLEKWDDIQPNKKKKVHYKIEGFDLALSSSSVNISSLTDFNDNILHYM